jgi:hypothetical protein
MASIVLIQGDSINEIITITDKDKEVINITGGTVKFRIVEDVDDIKAASEYYNDAVTITDAALGQATLTIARSVTKAWTPGEYKWEVEYIDSAGNVSHTIFSPCTIANSIYSEDT